MKKLILITVAAALTGILIHSCEKINQEEAYGKLTVSITDAPFPIDMVDSACVTITRIEIRKAGDGDPDGNPFITLSEDTLSFNLLELRNGVTESLPELEVPAGTYDLVRLYIDEASLKVKDGEEYRLKIPSGQQTGIKIFIRPALEVAGGLSSELLLDIDLSRSFVVQGNPHSPAGIKGFIFKPVIRAVNNSVAGSIAGFIRDTTGVAIEGGHVWIEQDTLVASAISDAGGFYAMTGIPAGSYTLFAATATSDTLTVEDLKVTAGNRTFQDIEF